MFECGTRIRFTLLTFLLHSIVTHGFSAPYSYRGSSPLGCLGLRPPPLSLSLSPIRTRTLTLTLPF